MRIRPATIHDSGDLAVLHVESWRWAYRGILPPEYLESLSIQQRAESWRQSLADPGALRTWLAETEHGELIGFVCTFPSRDPDALDGTAELGIYLAERWAGRGYGADLMERALADLLRQGFVEVTLWVLAANHRARRFYEREGFSTDGASKEDERPGAVLHEVRYRRTLVGTPRDK